jgi:hypothetical protein
MGFFKKSPPKELTSSEVQIQIPSGWSSQEGYGRPIPLEGLGHQKRLSRLLTFNSVVPIRLVFDSTDKRDLSIHSSIGWLADVYEGVRPHWRKRAVLAAEQKKIIVGQCEIYTSNDGSVRMRAYLNRPDEIAIDLTDTAPKALSDSQIEKALTALANLEDLYPETVAGVRSQAKKAVKQVLSLYQHALSLDEKNFLNKTQLLEICREFIEESEYSADYDESQLSFEGFVDDWRHCISGTGHFARSEFAIQDQKKVLENPNLASLLTGKSIVLYGEFKRFTREEAEEAIKARGGKSPRSVSGRTFALVCGDFRENEEIDTERQSDVPRIDEDKFLTLLDTGELNL